MIGAIRGCGFQLQSSWTQCLPKGGKPLSRSLFQLQRIAKQNAYSIQPLLHHLGLKANICGSGKAPTG